MTERRQPDPLGYEFTPLPRPATRALADGGIDAYDYAILGALYDRDVPRNLRVRFTLDQLREWTSWPYTDDALSKRVRRLRDAGWIAYEQPRPFVYRPTPGARRIRVYRYEVTLVPDPRFAAEVTEPSALGPSSHAVNQAASGAAIEGSGPTSTAPGPNSQRAEPDATEPVSANGASAAGPGSPEGPEKTLHREVEVVDARARESDEDSQRKAELDSAWRKSGVPRRERGYGWEPDS